MFYATEKDRLCAVGGGEKNPLIAASLEISELLIIASCRRGVPSKENT